MPYHTPILGAAATGNNTGEYMGYEVWVKGDGRVQLIKDGKTWLYHDYIDAMYWINLAEGVPVPVLTSLVPDTAPMDSAPFTLQVLGSGFVEDSIIVFRGTDDQETTYVSEGELTAAVTPPGVPANPPVQVRNGGTLSNALNFDFTKVTSQ